MLQHKYCCQNTAQNYLDHIISVPDNFDVNPGCLAGINKDEFIEGLKTLTGVVKQIYSDMINNPTEYGLPIVEDLEYKPHNPKAAESSHSSRRLVSLLHTLAQCGTLSNGKIVADKKSFAELCKKAKIPNTNMILNKLCDFGFIIEGFNGKGFGKNIEKIIFSYTGENVTPALFGYMKSNPLLKEAMFSLNYYLSISQDDLSECGHQDIFADYLSGEEREFHILLHEFMMKKGFVVGKFKAKEGFIVTKKHDFCAFSLEYFFRPKDTKCIMRCNSDHGKLLVRLKLDKFYDYAEHIEKMPERVKQVFRNVPHCRFCPGFENSPCSCRRQGTFEGKSYTICSLMKYFDIICYNPEDIEYYIQIILYELEARKNKNKAKDI